MRRTDALIIGAGQAGLAMSRCLATRGIDHVVLERGRVAERWRTGSWDSLRLLTPNWLNRLPDADDDGGADPHGFMRASGLVERLERYAAAADAPVETQTEVRSVTRLGVDYVVATSRGTLRTRCVVIATGQCQQALLPLFAGLLPRHIHQLTPAQYKRSDQLPDAPVLVVGASASGIQLAEEVHRSGRPVTLSVGRHTRVPRRYRGRDILAWMHDAGVLDDRAEHARDLARARQQPSLQLVGRDDGGNLDLLTLQATGVRIAGRAVRLREGALTFADDLALTTSASDRRLSRLLRRIDDFIAARGLTTDCGPPDAPLSVKIARPVASLDLGSIGTVIWATGYRRGYAWLHVPVLGPDGDILHSGGITAAPGLYVLGLPFLRRRKSNFIGGVGDDARELAQHLAAYLAGERRAAA